MASEEKYGFRDDVYSYWHREKSIERFCADKAEAHSLGLIDLDSVLWMECKRASYKNRYKREPYALMEIANYVGESSKNKCADVTKELARLANLPAVILLYKQADLANPAYPNKKDIEFFYYKRIYPCEGKWNKQTPSEWVQTLKIIRSVGEKMLDQQFWQIAKFRNGKEKNKGETQ